MPYVAPIYGFDINRTIEIPGLRIRPRFEDYDECREYAGDKHVFHLTAVAEFDATDERTIHQTLFDLAAVLSFSQQQWVMAEMSFEMDHGVEIDPVPVEFPDYTKTHWSRPTSGRIIKHTNFVPDVMRQFLETCLSKLVDKPFCDSTGFRAAFFRAADSCRMYRQTIDVQYYFLFSALEILARGHVKGSSSRDKVAPLMATLLQCHGFNVVQRVSRTPDPSYSSLVPISQGGRMHATQTYADLRNALFHNGEYEATLKDLERGQAVVLRLTDYFSPFNRLVADVLLKVMGYDDGYINWNRWLDRQPFIK